jgi:SAM-dependent methyltransferase
LNFHWNTPGAYATLLLAAAALAPAAGWSQDPGVVEDIPYVATPPAVVDEMLRLAQVKPHDIVYDLGSGDGRVVITAAKKFGAQAVGVEIDPRMVALSRAHASRAGVASRVRILQQDMFRTDLREATVVTMYLAPYMHARLRETLLGLRPGTRVVSHSSGFGDWQPDARTTLGKDVLMWRVPAKIAGRWQVRIDSSPGELRLGIHFDQRFQEISAEARFGAETVPVWEAALAGDSLRFVVLEPGAEVSWYFSGRVRDQVIEGTVDRGVGSARTSSAWRAIRAPN